jgi:Domain of unknown function (DUF5658)
LTLNPGEYRNWFYGAASAGKVFWNQDTGMLLLLFIALQLMDGLTTIWFLRHGVAEGNPLIRAVLGLSASPAAGLAISKIAAVTLALLAWRSGRQRMLWLVNAVFAGCVFWNVAATALG